MKVPVIGAGISGLGTAQALSSDGHEITVIEKRKALPTAGAALRPRSSSTTSRDTVTSGMTMSSSAARPRSSSPTSASWPSGPGSMISP
jgi:2-polyprenyl-6-methoxyphenol hydroxylase-like FAD-dependent oxidoreductase